MYCKKCHNLIDDDAEFCNHCGEKVNKNLESKGTAEEVPKVKLSKDLPEEVIEKVEPEKEEYTPIDPIPEIPKEEYKNEEVIPVRDIKEEYEPLPDEPLYDIPQQEETEYTPEPEKPERNKISAGRIFFASFISIFAFIFLLLFSFAFSVKLGISGDVIKKRVESMNIETLMDMNHNGKPLSKELFNTLDFSNATDGIADESSFREYMIKTNFLSFAGEKASDYVDYIFGSKRDAPSIQTEELVDFFKLNSAISVDVFNYGMKTADFNYLRKQIEQHHVAEDLSMTRLDTEAGFRLRNLSYFFSVITIGIILAIVLVLLIWIAVIVDRRGKHLAGIYGSVFFWSGIILLLIGIVSVAGTSVGYVFTSDGTYYVLASLLFPFSLFATATGLFELVIGCILKKIRKAIKNRERRERYVEKQIEKIVQ